MCSHHQNIIADVILLSKYIDKTFPFEEKKQAVTYIEIFIAADCEYDYDVIYWSSLRFISR